MRPRLQRQVSILLPNVRKYLSTTALFWTTGGGPAGGFKIVEIEQTNRERFAGPPQVAGATEGDNHLMIQTRYIYEILCRFDRKSIRLSEFADRAYYRFGTSATRRRSHDRATGKTWDAPCASRHL